MLIAMFPVNPDTIWLNSVVKNVGVLKLVAVYSEQMLKKKKKEKKERCLAIAYTRTEITSALELKLM